MQRNFVICSYRSRPIVTITVKYTKNITVVWTYNMSGRNKSLKMPICVL